ncbi:hypothetical protein A33M_3322 [Rhodovulum sp. PH10]|uniref:hypothetical protein n=1 Tax=Rhodovulum sp. PH10 TaxID=1187851 RepID=UPI00027C27F7|nr:hypothetical protein [Rhodovulum sp. PH10]EJW11244.1 hypothetical protein A33M_3322 [Rhodovulum sp. PH10]
MAGPWEQYQQAPADGPWNAYRREPQMEPVQSKGALGYVDDAVRAVANGVTFGWADELAAKADAVLGRGSYGENLKREKARTEAIPDPLRIPGEIVGAVAGSVAAAPVLGPMAAAAGVSRLPLALRSATAGAAGGAAFGAGEAEPGERMVGAAQGTVLGGALGGAAPYMVRGAGALAGRVQEAVSPRANVAADLRRAIARDADTPEALMQRAAGLQTVRPGVANLADAGGENVRGILERVAQTPGAGRTTVVPYLTGRQQGQANRIANDLRGLAGAHQSARQAIDEVIASRSADAAPLYRAAYEAGDRPIITPGLEALTGSPAVTRAMANAARNGQDRAIADGIGAFRPGVTVTEDGRVLFGHGPAGPPAYPNLQLWDYTYRELRDAGAELTRQGRNSQGAALTQIAAQMRDELDRAVPEFRSARQAWAGPSRFLEAIEEGRAITRASSEELIPRLGAMSEAEREGFRLGAVSEIVRRMGSDPARLGDMTKYLRSPEMRAKIAAIMPTPEAAQAWARRLDFEVDASGITGRSLGNSATARRLAEQADAQGIVGDLVMDAMTGAHGASMLRRVLGTGPRWLRDTLRSRADGLLAEILTDPAAAQQLRPILDRVRQRPAAVTDRTAAGAASGANAAFSGR